MKYSNALICYKPGRFAAGRVYIKPGPQIREVQYIDHLPAADRASLLHPTGTSIIQSDRSIDHRQQQQVHRSSMGTCGSPVLALASQQQGLLQSEPRPYTPSIWGDFFLKHQPCTPSQVPQDQYH